MGIWAMFSTPTTKAAANKRKEVTSRQSGETDCERHGRQNFDLYLPLPSYKYLMDCLEAGPVSLRVEVMQSVGR